MKSRLLDELSEIITEIRETHIEGVGVKSLEIDSRELRVTFTISPKLTLSEYIAKLEELRNNIPRVWTIGYQDAGESTCDIPAVANFRSCMSHISQSEIEKDYTDAIHPKVQTEMFSETEEV